MKLWGGLKKENAKNCVRTKKIFASFRIQTRNPHPIKLYPSHTAEVIKSNRLTSIVEDEKSSGQDETSVT